MKRNDSLNDPDIINENLLASRSFFRNYVLDSSLFNSMNEQTKHKPDKE